MPTKAVSIAAWVSPAGDAGMTTTRAIEEDDDNDRGGAGARGRHALSGSIPWRCTRCTDHARWWWREDATSTRDIDRRWGQGQGRGRQRQQRLRKAVAAGGCNVDAQRQQVAGTGTGSGTLKMMTIAHGGHGGRMQHGRATLTGGGDRDGDDNNNKDHAGWWRQ